MAIKSKKDKPPMIDIDLTGPEGNPVVLLGYARKICKQLGYSQYRTEAIIEEMMLTDYEGLIYTFDREFGFFINLWR